MGLNYTVVTELPKASDNIYPAMLALTRVAIQYDFYPDFKLKDGHGHISYLPVRDGGPVFDIQFLKVKPVNNTKTGF